MFLDPQAPSPLRSPILPDERVQEGTFWRRLVAWVRRGRAADAAVLTEGALLHMDDRTLQDIGAPPYLRDMAAQTRARHSRSEWESNLW